MLLPPICLIADKMPYSPAQGTSKLALDMTVRREQRKSSKRECIFREKIEEAVEKMFEKAAGRELSSKSLLKTCARPRTEQCNTSSLECMKSGLISPEYNCQGEMLERRRVKRVCKHKCFGKWRGCRRMLRTMFVM